MRNEDLYFDSQETGHAIFAVHVVKLLLLLDNITTMNSVWRAAMSEEVGKKMQAVVDRVNLAVTRRPKVNSLIYFS